MSRIVLGMALLALALSPGLGTAEPPGASPGAAEPESHSKGDGPPEERSDPAQVATGTFTGTTDRGERVVISLTQDGLTVHGTALVGDRRMALSGRVAWAAVGTLTDNEGTSRLIRLALSADGADLMIAGGDGGRLTLERGETMGSVAATTAEDPPGPYSGVFRGARDEIAVAELTLVQSGTLVSGVGSVLGSRVGVTGAVTEDATSGYERLRGVLTYLDETQIPFVADLAADGASIRLEGLGAPLDLQRTERSEP